MKMQTVLIIIIVLLFLVCFGSVIYNYNNIEVSEYDYKSEKVPQSFNGYKILQLSDLHSYQFGEDNKNLIEIIDKINPDIIVVTGDMVDNSDKKFTVCLELMKKLAQKYDVYYTFGNHEVAFVGEKYVNLVTDLKSTGINLLMNEKAEIYKGNEKINIYGMFYNAKYYLKFAKEYVNFDMLNSLIPERNNNEFNILLAHNPLDFKFLSQMNVDLIFSGHVHGGVVRLPFLGGLLSPTASLFPKYTKGVYSLGESKMVVSAGLGLGTIPFRIYNTPNLVVTTLITENNI